MKIQVEGKMITVKGNMIHLTPAIKLHMLKMEARGFHIKFIVS